MEQTRHLPEQLREVVEVRATAHTGQLGLTQSYEDTAVEVPDHLTGLPLVGHTQTFARTVVRTVPPSGSVTAARSCGVFRVDPRPARPGHEVVAGTVERPAAVPG